MVDGNGNSTHLRRGHQVTIPKGTIIWGTFPEHIKEAGRTYTVTVFDTGEWPEPYVCWAGTGGYWHNVRIEDLGHSKDWSPT